ncbi:MAG TPA: DUF2252 domain-containing protein [Ktedonobacteraceae bacterium]|nr:DUF2252 domain-containing protein [Ktedonobacteraceae bacterium]
MLTTTTSPTETRQWNRRLSTRAERFTAGKALRERVPRSSHGEWAPGPERPDPLSILEESNRTRLEHLVPIRYGRMALSPFAFLRGSAAVMASDLARTPISGIQAQICGDAHLSNFGIYASPERRQVFDVNDFDETLAGPWEWDVKRLAASVVVAARHNGYSTREIKQAVLKCMASYHTSMQRFATMHHLDVWYFHIQVENKVALECNKQRKFIDKLSARAHKRTRIETFPKLAGLVNGEYRIKEDPPLIVHSPDMLESEAWTAALFDYLTSLSEERRMLLSRYNEVDIARKVVGVGSVGTRCTIALFLGGAEGDDPLFLQIKEASASVLEPYMGASPYANHGQRVVHGQRLMQAVSDTLLGWSVFDGRDFYVRQLRDMKGSAEVERMKPNIFTMYVELCAATLARAHARTSDPAQISGYMGNKDQFDRAIAAFAESYADQTERDHAALIAAIQEGRIQAQSGV